jgi:hypothetical protein
MIYSEPDKEDFIKRVAEFKNGYKLYSFKTLKKHFNFNGRIVSPLTFPFKDIAGFLSAKFVILEDVEIRCLSDAVLLNAVCDFVLNSPVVFCLKTDKNFNIDDIFSLYLNFVKNSLEYMILDVYKTRLTFLAETRMINGGEYGGYTYSIANIILKINALGFYIKKTSSENYGKPYLFFSNDKKFEIKITAVPFRMNTASNGEFISKNGISINTTLTDIYFYPSELINKIKIFLGTAENARKPITINSRYNNAPLNKTALDKISAIQDISVKETSSPQLIIAGAGSGKTKIIVNKFLYLLNFIPADSIIILTFTNNAAAEIKNRIASCLRLKGIKNNFIAGNALNISTYHSFFYSIIKEFYKDLGFKSPPLINENRDNLGETSDKVFISYGEIILCVIELFRNNDILLEIASRFRFILIDEYQDLDFLSDYIIKKIDFARGSVMYAGDDDQAIYGFNGGDSFNILFFDLFFPSGKVFVLQNNFRSHYKIVDFCNSIINKIPFRYPKKLTAKTGNGEPPTNASRNNPVNVLRFKNKNAEEEFIKKMFNKLISQGKSTAILVRTQREAEHFETIIGGFYHDNFSSYSGGGFIGTIHRSKGLEFDAVFIANVTQGNIPHLKSISQANTARDALRHPFIKFLDSRIELKTGENDEAKLFYVAASRAKEIIFITYAGEMSEFLKD